MSFMWTEELIARAIRLTGEGLSASQVGKAIGTTKNAVIGKLHRVRSAAGAEVGVDGAPSKPKGSRKAKVALPETPRVKCYGPVDIQAIENDQCRFPLWPNSAKSGMYCGGRTATPSTSWCAAHLRVVAVPHAPGREHRRVHPSLAVA